MVDNHREQIYENLIAEETEDLLNIWQFGKIDDWDEEVFEVIKEILLDRLGYVPPQSIEFLISESIYRIEEFLENEELEKALSECELAIQLNPDFASIYNYRGEIYEELAQFENAITNYQKAIELSPNFKDAWESMLRIETILEEEFEESTTKKQLEQALEYAENGETEKALKTCESLKTTLPSIASAHVYYGSIFDTLDMLEPAVNSYRKAIQLNPESKDAWDNFLSIELALEEEEFDESIAKQHLDQALEYANNEEIENALAECEAAKPLMPNLAIAYNYLGLIFQILGQLEPAIESYRKAVQLNARCYPARENLASAKVAWEEEQYQVFSNLNPPEEQDVIETDETKIPVSDNPIPQWLYMNEKSFLLIGYPGYRNRQGRSGYDPIERNAEEARMQGIMLRLLFARKFRTRNPFYLSTMAFVGVLFSLYGFTPFMLGGITGIITGIVSSPYLIVGIAILVNVFLSLRLEKEDENEDNGYTFF